MQLILSAITSFFIAVSALFLPHTVVPKNETPHDYAFETLHITDYEALPGTKYGYCGPWAVSVAERYLGNETGEPTMEEWEQISNEVNVDPLTGGVTVQDLVSYYEARQFDITFVEMRKRSCDPQYYVARQLENKCIVMLLMFPKIDVGVGGHVETVLGVDKCETHTNSWGVDATITMENEYFHSNMTVYNDLPMEAVFMIACQ